MLQLFCLNIGFKFTMDKNFSSDLSDKDIHLSKITCKVQMGCALKNLWNFNLDILYILYFSFKFNKLY